MSRRATNVGLEVIEIFMPVLNVRNHTRTIYDGGSRPVGHVDLYPPRYIFRTIHFPSPALSMPPANEVNS